MAPSVPPSLKKIKVFLSRAEELDRDKNNPESRVVAYNCRQYAVLTGIPLAGSDAAAKSCLGELLGQLEGEKKAMAVFSKAEHWKICRKVADRVFEKADGEDRGGVATKGTAKTFYAAGTFYEILQEFHQEHKKKQGAEEDAGGEQGEEDARIEEEEQRRLYCKWKATDILNAIKEGRTPTPGGYQQEEMEDAAGALVGSPENSEIGGGLGGLPSITEMELPPAPSMPSSDMFNVNDTGANAYEMTNNEHQSEMTSNNVHDDVPNDNNYDEPPQYNAVELSLTGEPTPTVEDVNESSDDEGAGIGDIFIPGAENNAAANVNDDNDIFANAISPVMDPPPPPYEAAARTHDTTTTNPPIIPIPPPAATRPLPPPPAAAPRAPAPSPSSSSSGMFGGLFGKSSNSAKLSKAQMSDAVELTKFALAALQKGDGELGRERLEQALGVWRSAAKKHSLFGKSPSSPQKYHSTNFNNHHAIEHAKLALAALQKGDCKLGRQRLEQALGV